MRRTVAHAWLYVIAFFAFLFTQATLASSQGQSPYLLGLGELIMVISIRGL
jgi:hypothetical protein